MGKDRIDDIKVLAALLTAINQPGRIENIVKTINEKIIPVSPGYIKLTSAQRGDSMPLRQNIMQGSAKHAAGADQQ